MHAMNAEWWKEASETYSKWFKAFPRIIEFGSRNENGSLRDLLDLSACVEYICVDWMQGEGVDVVSLAHMVYIPHCFHIVVSASMLEHDPYWMKSIVNMVEHLHEGGILLLSWGAALNAEHGNEYAPDGGFHALPAGKVWTLLSLLGMSICEFFYEGTRYASRFNLPEGEGMGEVCLAAVKGDVFIPFAPRIEDLIEEDVWMPKQLFAQFLSTPLTRLH